MYSTGLSVIFLQRSPFVKLWAVARQITSSLKEIQNKHQENMFVKCLPPLNPTFIQQNLGMQGYTHFFLFLLQNIDCGYSLER